MSFKYTNILKKYTNICLLMLCMCTSVYALFMHFVRLNTSSEHHILMSLCVLVSFIHKILILNREVQGSFLGQHTPTTDEYFISHGHRLPYFPALLEDRAQKANNGRQWMAEGCCTLEKISCQFSCSGTHVQ